METILRVSLCFAILCVPVSSSMATEEMKVTRIDTHAHIVPPFYQDVLSLAAAAQGDKKPLPTWTVEGHLAFMDSMGIELSVLSVTPGVRFSLFDAEEGRKLARELNEHVHTVTLSHSERFQFFATLSLPDVEASVAEAIYAIDTLNAAGVILMANSLGLYVGDKKLDRLMEVLDAREAIVFIHPNGVGAPPVTNDVGGVRVEFPESMVDYLLCTTRAAANIVFNNVTSRYPNIKFILSHSGGFLPFAAHRVAGVLAWLRRETLEAGLKELQKFYVDTALSSTPYALPSTLQFIPHNHITFGPDYPFVPEPMIRSLTQSFDEYVLPNEKRSYMNFHCANGLLQKSLSHWRRVWHADSDKLLL